MCEVTSCLLSGVRPNGVGNRWNFCQLSVKPISLWILLRNRVGSRTLCNCNYVIWVVLGVPKIEALVKTHLEKCHSLNY